MPFKNADGRVTVIESIATAVPRFTVEQSDAAAFMLRTAGLSESLRKRIPQVYEKSAIARRHTCLQDYTRTHTEFDFYPRSADLCPSPSTAARNAVFERESVPLASAAVANALHEANILPADVTHLITVSCTGFFAPGLDVQLINDLAMSADVERTNIGFMGCCAAFNALKTANHICRSDAGAIVVVVSVELCTLHFQIADTLESVIVNALFSDGAAALVMKSTENAAGKLIYRDGASVLDDGSLGAMSWSIGDTGFMMGLSPKVPEIISKALPGFVANLLRKNGKSASDLKFWAVHPGGRQVLDRTAVILDLPECGLEFSYDTLRENGNMSSATILFILKKFMSNRSGQTSGPGVALAFGPGLTIEGCLLEMIPSD